MAIHVRSEQAADTVRISEVAELAFRHAEHTCGRERHLVEDLSSAGALTVSLVAVSELGIVGHVAVSPVTVSESVGEWFGPISVLPQCQRQGIGSQLWMPHSRNCGSGEREAACWWVIRDSTMAGGWR